MAVDRFTRYKVLRALWGRARALLARLGLPPVREAQARAIRWSQVQVAERHLADGVIRGTGDPDSAQRPLTTLPSVQQQTEAARQAWLDAHRLWEASHQAWLAQRRGGR